MAVPENEPNLKELLQDLAAAGNSQRILQWEFFRKGSKKVNTVHWAAFCIACEAEGIEFTDMGSHS